MWSAPTGLGVGYDMMLTAFLLAFFMTLLGTGGAQKEVREKKCDTCDPAVLSQGHLRFMPVRIRSLFLRGVANGIYNLVIMGFPSILLMWAGLRNESIDGFGYAVFKGFWAGTIAVFVFHLVFAAAVNKNNFPELEFESLVADQAAAGLDKGAPMVANVGLI